MSTNNQKALAARLRALAKSIRLLPSESHDLECAAATIDTPPVSRPTQKALTAAREGVALLAGVYSGRVIDARKVVDLVESAFAAYDAELRNSRAAADALDAPEPIASVQEARFWLGQKIDAVADAQENADYNEPEQASAELAAAKADCAIALDALIAAVRAERAPEDVRRAAQSVTEFLGGWPNVNGQYPAPHDLRALARFVLGGGA